MIHVITGVYKDIEGFRMYLNGLSIQTGVEFIAHVGISPTDVAEDMATLIRKSALDMLDVHYHSRRMGSLENFVTLARQSGAAPDDILVTIDGDDWLILPDALAIVEQAYDKDTWLTYGSWVSNRPGFPALLPAYEGEPDFRISRWLCTHLRTCRKWLFDRVKDEDLRDASGEYYMYPSDIPLWVPMLEMCGMKHIRHIPVALMLYNRASAYAMPDRERRARALEEIRNKPRYERIES